MKKILFGILILSIAGCLGCGKNEKVQYEDSKQEDNAKDSESVQNDADIPYKEGETIKINEEIQDNLYIDAEIEIPISTAQIYGTSLKKFNEDEMLQIFLTEAETDEIIKEYDELGGSAAQYQDQRLIITDGSVRYTKDEDIQYIRDLISYAEDFKMIDSDELGFQTIDEADTLVRSYLDKLNLGGELVKKEVYSINAEELYEVQEYCKQHDETFASFIANGKIMEKDHFEETDETYCLKYRFDLDNIPVFNSDEPGIAISGGIDAPSIAQTMDVTAYVSESGMRYIDILGVVEKDMEKIEEGNLIMIDGIKQSLEKKYGDVILANRLTISKIYLEYIPKSDITDYKKIEMIPTWCCEVQEEGSDFIQGERFHAITGEELS